MHEKRRYGEVILHRVTAPKSNQEAKDDAADIRAGGYRARIDTWQGGFAVWSDKGLTDATMPTRRQRAATGVRRGRRKKVPTMQANFDKICKSRDYPPPSFSFEGRIWGWQGTPWGPNAERDAKKFEETYVKRGYDVVWLRFKGGLMLGYVSKWKDGKKKPKYTGPEYSRATGHGKTKLVGVVGRLRKGRAPKTTTHKGKKWNLESCHLSLPEAKNIATAISDEYYTVIFISGFGTFCVYTRLKSRKKLDRKSVSVEVFSYLDRLARANVKKEQMPRVLVEMYGMSAGSSSSYVRKWAESREIDEKPATHEHRRGVSAGVYTTKAEVAVMKDKKKRTAADRPVKTRPKKVKLIDPAYRTTKTASDILKVRVDYVLAVREFGRGHVLFLVLVKDRWQIYEVKRKTRGPDKGKFGERKLVDKAGKLATKDAVLISFRREATRRGIKLRSRI